VIRGVTRLIRRWPLPRSIACWGLIGRAQLASTTIYTTVTTKIPGSVMSPLDHTAPSPPEGGSAESARRLHAASCTRGRRSPTAGTRAKPK